MARHDVRVYENIFEMMPDEDNPTPLVRVRNSLPAECDFQLYAKLEWMNPFGSVKDRAAWQMIQDLENRGEIGDGRGMVEPTSGNTGFSLAAMASVRGHHLRAVVPNKVPAEKKILLKMAGAELDVINDDLCPAPGLGDGSINLARSHAKAQKTRYVMPNQYENLKNIEAHIQSTGPEIWRQTEGKITHLFTSLGTCGTVTGTGRFLKEKNPEIKVIAVQPSPGHDVPGLRNVSQLDATKLFDASLIDEIMEIDFERAYTRSVELLRQDGLRGGPSSGLIFEGASQFVSRGGSGRGVMIFCDDVFKYTTNLVKHIPELGQGLEP